MTSMIASTSRIRPPICSLCRTLAKQLHTTSINSRQPTTTSYSNNSTSYNSGFRPTTQRSFNPNRSNNGSDWNKFKPKLPLSASQTSPIAIQNKLELHLQSTWINGEAWSRKTSLDLGFKHERFKNLAHKFAVGALNELNGTRETELIQWDFEQMRKNFIEDGMIGLERSVFSTFVQWAATLKMPTPTKNNLSPDPTLSKLHQLALCTDYKFPGETFPFARQERRKLILHVGPTNSGKTYNALVALARAKTGVYAGPLRLLAHEVFTRFNEGKIGTEGKRLCNLLTGEEQRILDPNAALSSCTVEMFPLGRKLEVGVIDEIQMIGDSQRGTAWTQAILGCQCDELHMCGEESVVELIQKIAFELGEELIIKRYTRLSPLVIAKESLRSDLSKIKRGDCLVTFSRNNIFRFKKEVEEKTGLKVAVAYGGLPPEVREEQARAFNEGKYDVLVASDAVGMGLNLKINRIVFESLRKYDGKAEVALSMPQIKQIAGRAGRFGVQTTGSIAALDDSPPIFTAPSNPGEVTTLDPQDMNLLREAINYPIVQVTQAALMAPSSAYTTIRNLLPKSTPFSKVYELMRTLVRTSPHYSPSPEIGTVAILDAIENIKPLTFSERSLFGRSPVAMRDPKVLYTFVEFVKSYARGEKILMKSWATDNGLHEELATLQEAKALKLLAKPGDNSTYILPFTQQSLATLESFHKCLTLYLWLSYRLPNVFSDSLNARPLRKEVENAIEFALEGMKSERIERMKYRKENNIVGIGPQGRFQGSLDRRDDKSYNNYNYNNNNRGGGGGGRRDFSRR